jgi:uncharacterized protein (DUF697 family)/GTPase SAR1 family protein
MDYDFGKVIDEKIKERLRERGRVNILIAGKTGVGKSTLINAVFQGDFAETGHGEPVTKNTREIIKEGIPLHIFDTRGLEMAQFGQTIEELERLITVRADSEDGNEHMHCGWICISEDGRRIEDGEKQLLEMLVRHMPVVVVVTKARSDNGFRAEVQRLLPKASNVIRVRAISETQDDGHVLPPMNLEALVEWTMGVVPEGQKNAFAAAQKVALRHKQARSHAIVAASATSAAAVGAAPIPFSDAILIVPIQISMLAGISAVFGLPLDSAFLTTLVSSTLAGAGGTIAGRAIVGSLLLLVPGAGPILKGVISGGTAIAFTTAFGEAYIAALSFLIEKDPHNPPTAEQIAKQFREEMAKANPFK